LSYEICSRAHAGFPRATKIRKDDEAAFKSVEQGMALQLIVDAKTDVLAILPTGGGKTMLFFLPTLMEPGMTTVAIVPLIAVMHDLRTQCVTMSLLCTFNHEK
jgi:superfamily II DNA helicase RecQ